MKLEGNGAMVAVVVGPQQKASASQSLVVALCSDVISMLKSSRTFLDECASVCGCCT